VGLRVKKNYIDLGFAKYDLMREKIKGFPEVIYGGNKTSEQIALITKASYSKSGKTLVTRINEVQFKEVKKLLGRTKDKPVYYEAAKILYLGNPQIKKAGKVLVICAGTSDLPVAEEAAVCCEIFGSKVERLFDVGVAGIHRLLHNMKTFEGANAIIVVAGMDGALPSVVGGLASVPVIAVPTSVGYGASFGGLSALLTMLNTCTTGVSVVNIDNGFGAAYQAHLINRLALGNK
jgi:NCAIR mutase (PurE)-related protein